MRFFFFITKSEQGGAQTHVAQLTRCFLSQKHKIAVMSAPGGWLEKETKWLGATFYANTLLNNTANPLRLWYTARALLQAVHNFQPDIVACHSTIAGLIGRFALRNCIPTIFTAHGWSFVDGTPFYRKRLMPIIEKMAARFCTKIICVSQNDLLLARKYRIAQEKKLVMIHNGVEISESFVNAKDDKKRNIPSDLVNVLFVGRLAPPKDPFLLIKAVANLPINIKKNVHLTLIGDGHQKQAVYNIVDKLGLNKQITITGALPQQYVLEAFKMADLFVLPTRYEGFPYTILEAMAHGLPVIASDVGGIKEAIGDDAGITVQSENVTALKNAIERLVTNPKLRARMGTIGCSKARTIFNLDTMCKKTLSVYLDVLQKT